MRPERHGEPEPLQLGVMEADFDSDDDDVDEIGPPTPAIVPDVGRSRRDVSCFSSVENTLNPQFTVLFSDGGHFSSDYLVENLLRNRGVYCSERSHDINIVLRFEHPREAPFTLTSVVVVAPVVGFTSPVGTGLVFVSWDKPDLEACSAWDGCTRERYEAQCQARDRLRPPSESDPAAFFDLERSSSRCVELVPPRAGRYVLLKLIRPRPGSKGTNVDCEYVGLRGFCGVQGFPSGELR